MTNGRSRSSGRPTLDQVAARAGVARATASRVLNGSAQVSDASRELVEQAAADLGYIPNVAARSLVTHRTDSIALVAFEPERRVFGDPWFARVIRGVSGVLGQTDLHLWIAFAQSAAERARIGYYLTGDHVDGVLLLSLHHSDPLPRTLSQRGLPTVVAGRSLTADASAAGHVGPDLTNYVDIDDAGGARLAVRHLLATGRRRIAMIAGPQHLGFCVARLRGYREALAQARIPFDPDLVAYGDLSDDSGAAAVRHLLELRPDLDGVVVGSDAMAAGALRGLRGWRSVPEQVSVVGFDNSLLAQHTVPALTTVDVPAEEMGRQMASVLIDAIAGAPPIGIVLDTHLVRRHSA
ncbi:LacI family DNA-binding transcriptional regulator [Luedemannella helvata]|uniref:LacI family DNA-binding transcriptional regulator n=1 Tax=Luedemannella helvata TaxID=349315 RepID=A0ABP4W1X4_9ACTN